MWQASLQEADERGHREAMALKHVTRIKHRVAVGILHAWRAHAAEERLQMLRAEVEILRSIRHPNIVM